MPSVVRLIAYQVSPAAPTLRPASPRREWMDATNQRFAYRCLPLTIANQHGWELLCPCAFEAEWNGEVGPHAIRVEPLGGAGGILPGSHFGEGVLTFHTEYLFRTESPYNLMVTGPINHRKDGIAPLSAIVETDWLPFTFTMNWVFTRPGVPVRFDEGEPFCQLFPLDCAVAESARPEIRALESDPELLAKYQGWCAARGDFNQALNDPNSQATRDQWQRFYMRGTLHTGEPVAPERHRTRLNLCPFTSAGGVAD
jgi:hypothetical protein